MSPDRSRLATALVVFSFISLTLFLAPSPAAAQPFGGWLVLNGTTAYVTTPHSPLLNPTTAITLEGWSSINNPAGSGENCRSFIGKNYQAAYWVGVCNGNLRSYMNGGGSSQEGGKIPSGFFHWAVTFDGTTRRHYINGEEKLSVTSPSPLGQSTSPLEIGSDVSWRFHPGGTFDEVRIWSVARTKAQIRSTINVRISDPQSGLVAVFGFDGAGVGGFPLSAVGGAGILTFAAGPVGCTTTATNLCLHNRFVLNVNWETDTGVTGGGKVVPGYSSDSGIFWFFAPNNWELLVKVLNGCALGGNYWTFSAATTNVHYELVVFDTKSLQMKRYFNYQGENAPAVNDTAAFHACP